MELEDFRLLYNVWFNSRQDHHLDFPYWLYGNAYNVESVLQYEDEASQQAWLEKEIQEYLKTGIRSSDEYSRVRRDNGRANNGLSK